MRTLGRFAAWLLAMCVASSAGAQDYPRGTVKIIAGSPGTLMDVTARLVAQRLAERLAQPVIVENRGGAGFTIGAAAAAQAAPDGHTLVMGDRTALSAGPHLYKNVTYDPFKDFAPITLAAVAPLVMIVHPSVPASTLPEFVAYAKTQPSVDWATASSAGTVIAEKLGRATGIKPVFIPYKGSAESQRAILGGEPKVGLVTAPSTYELVAAGKLKALAVTSSERLAAAPSVPTTAEAGFPDLGYEYWVGLLAPAGTPAAIIARLNREVTEILRSEKVREALVKQGANVASGTPDQMAARMRADFVAVRQEVEMLGLVPQ